MAAWVVVGGPRTSTPEARPKPTVPTTHGPQTTTPASTHRPTSAPRHQGIEVVMLNASKTAGLAAKAAKDAKSSGWKVAEVGNWIYPAVLNAVYYPQGHEEDAADLSKDLSIDAVRPRTSGMSADYLTVILVSSP